MRRITVSTTLRVLGWLTLGLSAGSAISAQEAGEQLVRDAVTCSRCELRHETRVVFSSNRIEGEINHLPFGVRVDPRGNFWVLAESAPPRSYNSTGSFTRTFGRNGRGPGEFASVHDMFWVAGDSFVTMDAGNRRATVFAPNGRYVRDIRTPAQLGQTIVLQWPTRVLVSGRVPASATAGPLLHIASFADDDAKLTRSFAPDRGGYPGTNRHVTARGKDGSIVTAKPERFRIYVWDHEGTRRSTLVRRSSWFPDTGAARIGTPDRPPTPGIAHIGVDQEGLIWLFVRIAAPTWRRAWPRVPPGTREVMSSQIDFPSLFNTRVEVIDPASQRLLTTMELPGLVVSVLGSGRVAVYGAGANGESALRIDEMRLVRPDRE